MQHFQREVVERDVFGRSAHCGHVTLRAVRGAPPAAPHQPTTASVRAARRAWIRSDNLFCSAVNPRHHFRRQRRALRVIRRSSPVRQSTSCDAAARPVAAVVRVIDGSWGGVSEAGSVGGDGGERWLSVANRRSIRRMPRLQVYLPDDLHDELKRRGLPASELLQIALRAELERQDALDATATYLEELAAEVGEPTTRQRIHSDSIARRVRDRGLGQAG